MLTTSVLILPLNVVQADVNAAIITSSLTTTDVVHVNLNVKC